MLCISIINVITSIGISIRANINEIYIVITTAGIIVTIIFVGIGIIMIGVTVIVVIVIAIGITLIINDNTIAYINISNMIEYGIWMRSMQPESAQ